MSLHAASTADEFDAIRELLAIWPCEVDPAAFTFDTHSRLASCLNDLRKETAIGSADLAALVAATLKHETARTPGADLVIDGSTGAWPPAGSWASLGVIATPTGSGRLRLTASDWRPSWLPGAAENSPDAGLFDAERHDRRIVSTVAADPTFTAALGPGFANYVTPGQRQAVRSVLAAKPGATIVVSLPTGGGKTEIALAEAMRPPQPVATLVVVPTVGLALDQERRIRQLLRSRGDSEASQRPFAYVSDASAEERSVMRRRVRSGEQGVLFTSPESAVGSLAPALCDAASNGVLRLFVVDEAHLVAAWGGDFRPEFQAVAGLRTALLRASSGAGHQPFKTVLLSATIAQTTLDLLERLFSEPGPFETVLATALRGEPSYWSTHCADEVEREQRLLEAVSHLPRPLIVYVATRGDAARWGDCLRRAGYRALRTFTGDSTGAERREVLESLRGPWSREKRRTDIVVATTAFGVGVDQPNIRGVIHLCVPESLDRFYQEVGRGGRDGHPSISLVLWIDGDLGIAESLALERLITPEKGLDRWHAMQATAIDMGDGRRTVALDARPPHLSFSSRANRLWNLRTIALMAQAKLIDLDAERPAATRESLSDPLDDLLAESALAPTAVIRLRRGDASTSEAWNHHVIPIRTSLIGAKLAGLAAMRAALRARAKVCEALQSAYRVTVPAGNVIPAASCGGCPGCRPREPYVAIPPEPPPLRHLTGVISEELIRLFGRTNSLVVTWAADSSNTTREGRQELAFFLRSCLGHGIEVVVASTSMLSRLDLHSALRHTRRGLLFAQAEVRRLTLLPNLPTLVVDLEMPDELLAAILSDSSQSPPRIILTTDDRPDPFDPTRKLSDRYQPRYSMPSFLERL